MVAEAKACSTKVKVRVCRKVYVNSQGYAYGGRQYFGTGVPLYYYELEDGRSGHTRAYSRAKAIWYAQCLTQTVGVQHGED